MIGLLMWTVLLVTAFIAAGVVVLGRIPDDPEHDVTRGFLQVALMVLATAVLMALGLATRPTP